MSALAVSKTPQVVPVKQQGRDCRPPAGPTLPGNAVPVSKHRPGSPSLHKRIATGAQPHYRLVVACALLTPAWSACPGCCCRELYVQLPYLQALDIDGNPCMRGSGAKHDVVCVPVAAVVWGVGSAVVELAVVVPMVWHVCRSGRFQASRSWTVTRSVTLTVTSHVWMPRPRQGRHHGTVSASATRVHHRRSCSRLGVRC